VDPSTDTVSPVRLSTAPADRVAGVIVATTGVALGLLGALNGEILGIALCVVLLGLSRALLARSVVADSSGLHFCDGVFSHRLRWDQVDGFTADRGVVYVLHQDRYVDRLPLPGTRRGNRQVTDELADPQESLRNASTGHDTPICRSRILGGVRGRLGLTVVRLEKDGSLTWIQGPSPAEEDLAALRLTRNRRRAESARQAEALRIDNAST
jgi:hypothetical protein